MAEESLTENQPRIEEGTIEFDPITGKQRQFTNQQWVDLPMATESIITDSSQAQTATKDNIAYLNEQVAGIYAQASKLQEALKSGQITGLTPKTPEGPVYDVDMISPTGERQRRSSKDVQNLLAQGYVVATGIPEEILGEGEVAVETPEEKLIKEQKAISDALAADIKSANDELELAKANADALTQNIIIGLQDSYKAQAAQQEELNRRAEAITRTIGIRFGTERYAPQLAGDIVTAQARAGLRQLAILRAQTDELIMQAKAAKTDRDFALLDKKVQDIKDAKKESDKILLDLRKEQLKKSDELEAKLQKAKTEDSIINIYDSGITDRVGIYNALKGQVGIKEIDDILDMIQEKKEVTDADRINQVTSMLREKMTDEGNITATDYIQAQREWIGMGGNVAEFKAAFPIEAMMTPEELAKMPESIYKLPVGPAEKTVGWSEWAAKYGLVGLPVNEAQRLYPEIKRNDEIGGVIDRINTFIQAREGVFGAVKQMSTREEGAIDLLITTLQSESDYLTNEEIDIEVRSRVEAYEKAKAEAEKAEKKPPSILKPWEWKFWEEAHTELKETFGIKMPKILGF